MRFRISHGLYDDQRDMLEKASIDQRVEYEELAAHFEWDAGEAIPHAERRAYSVIQWKYQWNKSVARGGRG